MHKLQNWHQSTFSPPAAASKHFSSHFWRVTFVGATVMSPPVKLGKWKKQEQNVLFASAFFRPRKCWWQWGSGAIFSQICYKKLSTLSPRHNDYVRLSERYGERSSRRNFPKNQVGGNICMSHYWNIWRKALNIQNILLLLLCGFFFFLWNILFLTGW